jgi:hypothetical protein
LDASLCAFCFIETKYGFEKVFRINATFTDLPPELPELPPAAALLDELELLEPHAATVSTTTTAKMAASSRRLRVPVGVIPSGGPE